MSFFKDLSPELTLIPGFMQKLGWPKASMLMQEWFDGSANDDPFKGTVDSTTISMDWILGFPRARAIYDSMVREKVWVNTAAQGRIIQMLRKKGLVRAGVPCTFGNLKAPVATLRADQINTHKFKADIMNDPLDDLYGSLGDFNFDVCIEGKLAPVPKSMPDIRVRPTPFSPIQQLTALKSEVVVTVTQVGIFAWDKFDFNGPQPLGLWNFKTGEVRRPSLSKGLVDFDELDNGDFRDWRTANNKGGDYLVYTDVKTIPLSSPAYFTFTP